MTKFGIFKTKGRTVALAAIAHTALSLACAPADAAVMWVVENQSDQVFKIDTTTWAATLVGAAGVNLFFGGLGFDRASTLYAIAGNNFNTIRTNKSRWRRYA